MICDRVLPLNSMDLYGSVSNFTCKTGERCGIVRAKLKNMVNGSVVERKFNAGIKLQPAIVERKPMQYLYEADESYCFMDTETYEQIMLRKDQLGDKINFLKEEMECSVMFSMGILSGLIFRTLLS